MKSYLHRALFLFIGSLTLLHSCGTRSYVGDRLRASQLFSTNNIAVSDSDRFTFAVVGDLHIGGGVTARLRDILQQAKDEGDAFVAFLGDIVDSGDEEDFRAVIKAVEEVGFEGRFLPVIGNHDVFENGWEHYVKHFGPSHYSVTVGNSQLIALDTADGTLGEAQSEWLLSMLQASSAKNRFLLSHYLPIVPGIRTYLKLSSERESLRLMKLAETAGVRAWLGAHYHSYKVGKVGSVDYVVAGGGGGRRMDPVLDFFYVQARVDGDQVTYRLRVVP